MSDYSIFDIAGPIMIGPSSSHTAGAAKIGLIARHLFGRQPESVVFYLHGSFAQVYAGHATDRALLGGMLGFETDDTRIKNAFDEAEKNQLSFEFKTKDLGKERHANTVRIVMRGPSLGGEQSLAASQRGPNSDGTREQVSVLGSSIGGGMIVIHEIDYFTVKMPCSMARQFLLTIWYEHRAGFIEDLQNYLAKRKVRVGEWHVHRDPRAINYGLAQFLLDDDLDQEGIEFVKSLNGIIKIRILNHLRV